MPDIEKLIAEFENPSVIELMINPDGSVYAEAAGKGITRVLAAPTQQDVAAFLNGVVGSPEAFGPDRPYADLSALDGSRVHVLAPPLAAGLAVTIRKRPARRPTLDEIVEAGTLTPSCAAFLRFLVEQKQNVLVAGGASSGKTTLMSALAAYAGEKERIVVLEDTPELTLPQRHVLYLRTRRRDAAGRGDVTLRDLVVNTLRMRPDRVIVGETRGVEAADMLQAMNVGMDGMLSTLHAGSAREALQRLETLVLQAGADMPLKAVRSSIATAVDFIVFMSRLADGTRRVVEVAELTGMEMETITLTKTFSMEVRKTPQGLAGALAPGGVPRLFDRLKAAGGTPPIELFRAG